MEALEVRTMAEVAHEVTLLTHNKQARMELWSRHPSGPPPLDPQPVVHALIGGQHVTCVGTMAKRRRREPYLSLTWRIDGCNVSARTVAQLEEQLGTLNNDLEMPQ